MKKVLFIASRPLYPVVGGDQIRTVQQLKFLAESYKVDVVFLSESDDNEDIHKYIPNVGYVTHFRQSKLRAYLQTLKFLYNKLPLQVNYYNNRKAGKYISKVAKNYDFVFCNLIRTAPYVINLPITKYIDFVDAISMNYEKARRKAKGLMKLIYQIDYLRCKNYEAECLRKFNSCAIISEVDKDYILKHSK